MVGQRVVVRHLLADGRATDVLGVCTAYDDASLTVERDGQGPTRIPLEAIVTGKPVPPRASVRARVGAREVEEQIGALWSSHHTEPLGAWLLRASPPHGGRLRRRGNSALAMADPGLDLAEAVARVRAFYRRLDQDPWIQVQADSRLETTLADHGFLRAPDGDAHAQLAPVAQALRAARGTAAGVEASHDDRSGRVPTVTVTLGDSWATGRGVLSGDWLLLDSVEVQAARRRQGLATAVLAELLDWGASQGARTALLHVEVGNEPALGLYDGLGFRTHHTNRYLRG